MCKGGKSNTLKLKIKQVCEKNNNKSLVLSNAYTYNTFIFWFGVF